MSLREEFDKRRMDYVKNYSEANNLDAYSVIWYADEVISHQEVIISQERQAKEELLEALGKTTRTLRNLQETLSGWHLNGNFELIDNFFDDNWEADLDLLHNKQLIDKHTEKDKEIEE